VQLYVIKQQPISQFNRNKGMAIYLLQFLPVVAVALRLLATDTQPMPSKVIASRKVHGGILLVGAYRGSLEQRYSNYS
jgi:hypothetical protein